MGARVYENEDPFVAHADWVEIGWALRGGVPGDTATPRRSGRAGSKYAFDNLGVQAVVSCTVRHNVRSRAVMERIGMRYAGEIRSRGAVEGLEGLHDDAAVRGVRVAAPVTAAWPPLTGIA